MINGKELEGARDALNLAGVPRLKRLSAGNWARLAVHRG